MTTIGLDISHWQGALTAEIVAQMWAAGVRFVYHKISQGVDYKDDKAAGNIRLLQAGGMLTGGYHFVTRDNANDQFSWFVGCMAGLDFTLPPAQDVEMNPTDRTYPTQATVDVIGRSLTDWMKFEPQLAAFPYPAIYTNPSSGNRVITSANMSRYLLWIANWRVPTPNLPKVWQGKPYFIWQDNVVDASPYGLTGQVDHDFWGTYMPFPGQPPATDELETTVRYPDGRTFKGLVREVVE